MNKKLFVQIILGIIILLILFYGCLFIVDLIYYDNNSFDLHKYFVVLLIFLPFIIFVAFIFLLADTLFAFLKVKTRRSVQMRFRLSFLMITLIPSMLYVVLLYRVIDNIIDLSITQDIASGLSIAIDETKSKLMQERIFIDQWVEENHQVIKSNITLLNNKEKIREHHSSLFPHIDIKENKRYLFYDAAKFNKKNRFNLNEFKWINNFQKKQFNLLVYRDNNFHHNAQRLEQSNLIQNYFIFYQNISLKKVKIFLEDLKYYQKHSITNHYNEKHSYNFVYHLPSSIFLFQDIESILNKDISKLKKSMAYISHFYFFKNEIKIGIVAFYFYFFFAILLFGVIVFDWQSKRVIIPVTSMIKASENISKGILNVKLPFLKSGGEISHLVRVFRRMSIEIKQNREKIKKISEIEAWRNVAVRIAHEIKNPLTPIKLSVDQIEQTIMRHNLEFYNQVLPNLNLIHSEIDTIQKLIGNFSSYSTPFIYQKKVVLCSSLIDILKEYLDIYQDKVKVKLINQLNDDQNITFFADLDRLKQAFFNLIKNAFESLEKIEYALLRISIQYHCNKEKILFTIYDNGEGISNKNQQQLFAGNFTTKLNGSGLGLLNVREIIQAHKGYIYFSSYNRETYFYISLPINQ